MDDTSEFHRDATAVIVEDVLVYEFTAVLPVSLNSGTFALPDGLPTPQLESWMDHGEHVQVVNAVFGDVAVHSQHPQGADFGGEDLGVQWHFHVGDGPGQTESPWDDARTVAVLQWLIGLHIDVDILATMLEPEVNTASDWYGRGFSFYPGNEKYLEAEGLCGEVVIEAPEPLPLGTWPGTGHGDIRHAIDDSNDMWLQWNPQHVDPDRVIGRIRTLDDGTVEAELAEDTPWDAVGVSPEDAGEWMGVAYHNHLLVHGMEKDLYSAAIRVIAGV